MIFKVPPQWTPHWINHCDLVSVYDVHEIVANRVIGSCIGLVFHMINKAAGSLGVVFDLSPVLSAMFPVAATFMAAVGSSDQSKELTDKIHHP